MHLRDSLVPRYAEMVYYGYWFAPEREHAAGRRSTRRSARVTGTARLKLYKGSVTVAGRKSPSARSTTRSIATFEAGGGYHQADADGLHPPERRCGCASRRWSQSAAREDGA